MALLLLVAAAVHAEGINVERAELQADDETYQVNADFGVTFSREVEEAINRGVTLNFLVEFVLMEPNKYWLDQEISSASLSMRLSYHALSRQYILTTGTRQSTYATLQEAVEELGKVRAWTVMEKAAIKKKPLTTPCCVCDWIRTNYPNLCRFLRSVRKAGIWCRNVTAGHPCWKNRKPVNR